MVTIYIHIKLEKKALPKVHLITSHNYAHTDTAKTTPVVVKGSLIWCAVSLYLYIVKMCGSTDTPNHKNKFRSKSMCQVC